MAYIKDDSSIIDEPVEIGEGTRIGPFCHIQSEAVIGKECTFGQSVHVGTCVKIGDHCKIQNNVSIYEGVVLEDYVFCGPSMCFANDATPRSKYPKGLIGCRQSLVKEGASIGANATVIVGNTIGRHAMIGAGAVVTKAVPDHALMLGVPARQTGWACECGVQLNRALLCETCGRQYEAYSAGLKKVHTK
jgi:UDP-2-acetamido-3-amino-2,3-dideoxy-glucuronate N-acetyltransferase